MPTDKLTPLLQEKLEDVFIALEYLSMKRIGALVAIEKDPALAARLRLEFAALPHVEIVTGDAESKSYAGTLRNIPSDRFVELLAAGEFKGKPLLVLDAVGKQVEWIQYYLEQYGYTGYYFMDKGVTSAAAAGAVK